MSLVGEYPSRLHPVIWMGRLTDWLIEGAPPSGPQLQFGYGVLVVIIVTLATALPAWLALNFAQSIHPVAYIVIGALVLKPSFALRELWGSVEAVRQALEASNLQEARRLVGRIVSRDTAALTPAQVTAGCNRVGRGELYRQLHGPHLLFRALRTGWGHRLPRREHPRCHDRLSWPLRISGQARSPSG